MVRFLTGHYRHCSWPVKKASSGMCSCRWWTFWIPFVNKLANNLQFFMSFWIKWLLSIMSDFYCVDAWRSIGLPRLTSKVKLVKNSEQTKCKMLIFCIVLIFAVIFVTFDRYLLYRWYKLTFETFYVHEKYKISDFKFPKVMQQHT